MCPIRSVYLCVRSLTTVANETEYSLKTTSSELSGSDPSEKPPRLLSLNSEEFNYRERLRPLW
jgi:hypothetical protein